MIGVRASGNGKWSVHYMAMEVDVIVGLPMLSVITDVIVDMSGEMASELALTIGDFAITS